MAGIKSLITAETETQFRQFVAYLFSQVSVGKAATGVLAGLGVTATTPSASGSVVVGAGAGVCQPTTAGGVFPLVEPSDETVDVFTANPMQFVANPRNDIVVFDQVTGLVAVLTGTPGAIPTDPTVPSTAIPLARLRHLANVTTIPSGQIDQLGTATALLPDTTRLGVTTSLTGKRVHRQAFAGGTTDASGFITVTHAAGFTPSLVQVELTAPSSSFAVPWGTDSYTGTTFRARFHDARPADADGYYTGTTGTFSAIFWE